MEIKYDTIGANYNQSRKADKYLAGRLLFHLNPKKNACYLDIGCGTGNYTNEFQKKGFQFIGIDPSEKMLQIAREKNQQTEWRPGTAENTNLENNKVDGIIAFLTIHHWTDLPKAFAELYRVLKENGRIVIFTSSPKQMKAYWLNHYFPLMLHDSIIQMPSYKSVGSAMSDNGFEIIETEKYSVKPDLEDHFLYCGKQNPELYFDENVRHGISSFSSLANREEVERGLAELKKDMQNGKINEVMNAHEKDLGDYLFIIGRKPADKRK